MVKEGEYIGAEGENRERFVNETGKKGRNKKWIIGIIILIIIVASSIFIWKNYIFPRYIETQYEVLEVTGLNAEPTGFGSSILLKWNKVKGSRGYAVARFEIIDGVAKNYETLPGDPNSNHLMDYSTQEGKIYGYKAIASTGLFHRDSDFEGAEEIRVTAEKGKDLSNERVVFVMPKEFLETGDDLENISESIIEGVNRLFNETNKQFTFEGIIFYDSSKCEKPSCIDITNDAEYIRTGVLTVFYLPYPNDYLASASLNDGSPPHIVMGPGSRDFAYSHFFDGGEDGIYTYTYEHHVHTMAHEFAHTYGVGVPEYYSYDSIFGKDLSVIGLERYNNDPMFWTYDIESLDELKFGPLSISIINENLDHTQLSLFPKIDNFYNLYPERISINIENKQGNPLEGINLEIFCIDSGEFGSETSHDSRIVKTLNNQKGIISLETNFLREEVLCPSIEIRAEKEGYISSQKYLTRLELQEAKIAYNQTVFDFEITMGGE